MLDLVQTVAYIQHTHRAARVIGIARVIIMTDPSSLSLHIYIYR